MKSAAAALLFLLSGCASMNVACPELDAGPEVDAELLDAGVDARTDAGPADAGVDASAHGPFVDDVNAACMQAQAARLDAAARLACPTGAEYEGCRSTALDVPVRDVHACIAARAAATSCDDLEPASCARFTIDAAGAS